jgi:hypothetical protein
MKAKDECRKHSSRVRMEGECYKEEVVRQQCCRVRVEGVKRRKQRCLLEKRLFEKRLPRRLWTKERELFRRQIYEIVVTISIDGESK